MTIPVGAETGSTRLIDKANVMVVLDVKASCTEADDGSLISCQAHPADDSGFRRTDGLLTVIQAVNISFVETLQVGPETNQTLVMIQVKNTPL